MHFPPAAANNGQCEYFARIRKLKKQNNVSYILYEARGYISIYYLCSICSSHILVPKENIDMYNQKIFVHVPENICVCCVVRDKDKAWLLNKRRRDHSLAPGPAPSQRTQSHTTRDIYNFYKIYTILPIYSFFIPYFHFSWR